MRMADRVGQQLGNYRLVRLLGSGGFAEVYLGEHIRLGTEAAIKILHTRLASDEEVEAFQNEGRTIARLIHPHIIRVFDFDVEDDIPFMVMDYAPNGTLRKRHPRGEKLSLETILPYVQQVADALQYAHDQHLINRDVKPENMLLGRHNEVLLSDFGTALMIGQTTGYQSVDKEIIGTVSYMAPEMFQGKPRPASDQYALGIVIYEWLSGELPFHGSATEVAIQHAMATPPSLQEKVPGISSLVEQVIMRALAKDYHDRFPSVREFAQALEQASRGERAFYSEPTIAVPQMHVGPEQQPSPLADAPTVQAQTPEQPSSLVDAPTMQSPTPAQDTPLLKPAPLAVETATAEPLPGAIPSTPRPFGYMEMSPPPNTPLPDEPIAYPVQSQPRNGKRPLLILSLLLVMLLLMGSIIWMLHMRSLKSAPTVHYPQVAGVYSGRIHNTTADIRAPMSLTIQQAQGQLTGTFTVSAPLQGSGPLTGTISVDRHIQFQVMGKDVKAPLLFTGTFQKSGHLTGTYCSLGSNGQCDAQAGGAGTWDVSP